MTKLFLKNKNFFILLIILFSLIIRFANLNERFSFSGEMGDNLLAIKNYILDRRVPLLGPPTSHPWLYFGSYYYWLMIPVLILFNFNPLSAAYLGAVLGVAIVVLNYLVVDKLFSRKVALFSTMIIALSPLFLGYTLESRFYFFVVPLFYILLFFLEKFWHGQKQTIFYIGLFYGLMLSFHFSVVLILPSLGIIFYLKQKKIKLKNYLYLAISFLIPNIPVLISDAENNFLMLRQFILWIPYRIFGFLGFVEKNRASFSSIFGSFSIFVELFGITFTNQSKLWLIITAFIFGLMIYLIKNKKVKMQEFPWIFLFSSLFFALLGIVIHGSAPLHYLLPVFPIPAIIVAFALANLIKGTTNYLFIFLIFVLLNLGLYRDTFFNRKAEVDLGSYFISYKIQKEIAQIIVNDAKGKRFALQRVGYFDYFNNYYAQNYHYLLWYLGNEPIKKADLTYTIYEDTSKLPKEVRAEIFWVNKIAIIRQ